jgi:hypothetical protein
MELEQTLKMETDLLVVQWVLTVAKVEFPIIMLESLYSVKHMLLELQ